LQNSFLERSNYLNLREKNTLNLVEILNGPVGSNPNVSNLMIDNILNTKYKLRVYEKASRRIVDLCKIFVTKTSDVILVFTGYVCGKQLRIIMSKDGLAIYTLDILIIRYVKMCQKMLKVFLSLCSLRYILHPGK